ncbi:MAG: hypothetical protein AAB412_00135 [Elusimicrobiota bacterium]
MKLKQYQKTKRSISVQEFLGGKVVAIIIEFVDKEGVKDFSAGQAVIQRQLERTIVSPKPNHEQPQPFAYWAEGTFATVRALIRYEDGFIGRIETDGAHLFFQDSDGLYWWYRGRDDGGVPANQGIERPTLR